MKKRGYGVILTVLLSIALIVSACSSGGGGNSAANNGSNSGSEASGNNGNKEAEGKEGDGKKDTITVTTPRWPNTLSYEYGENALTTFATDKTGIGVKWNLFPDADKMQKLNLELSSGGDLGDVIMGDFGIDNSFLATYGSQGTILPLEDLIEQHAPNIKRQFEEYPDMKRAVTAPDGHIYGLAELGACYNCDRAMRFWANADFLKALNMETPTTTEELYQYLKAVKEKDPNGNGQADEIGITGSPKSWFANVHQFILHAWTHFDGNGLFVNNDKVTAAYATEEWRDGLRYLNKLYEEGLIDPAAFTNDENQMKQTVELNDGNTVGAVAGGGQHVFAANDETRKRYDIVLPLTGPSGFRSAFRNDYGIIAGYKFVIPASAKNPEAAIKWIDFMYTEEANLRGRYGTPGEHWEEPKDAIAANGGPAKFKIIGKDIWQDPQSAHWHGANTVWMPFGSDAREKLPEDQFDLETELYNAAVEYEKSASKVSVPKFFFEPDNAQRYNELKEALKKYYEAATADFIVGNRDVEGDWKSYLAELKSVGLDEFLEIQQAEYDRNWKN
jgi:putative aldouronate transport system substrate-binding protein